MQTVYFSTGTAIVLTLLATTMWGSWMQVIKHRKDYPLSGISFLLYSFSFVFIWIITLLLAPVLLPDGIIATTASNINTIPRILIGGAMMGLGMLINLQVMQAVGLLLSTAISGALGSLLGLTTSIMQEGVPAGSNSITLLICCTCVFIVAGFVCNHSAILRDRDKAAANSQSADKSSRGGVTTKMILLLLLSTLLVNGWSIGTASGTSNGVPPILTCAYMATGSFFSVAIVCGIYYTITKKWAIVLCWGSSKKPLVLGLIGAICHYGGNLISIYAMPVISATLSFLFGRTANIWTYFWGFYYREFAGAKKRTYIVLSIGIALYFFGIALLGFFKYAN